MAQVLTASFGPDKLFQIMFPHQDIYSEDFVTAFRRKLREGWWDYSKVLMVSYETQTSRVEDLDDEKRALVTTRGGEKEVITGMIEWQRVGLGWEHVWNLWGWWDPSKFDQVSETAHITIFVAPRVITYERNSVQAEYCRCPATFLEYPLTLSTNRAAHPEIRPIPPQSPIPPQAVSCIRASYSARS